MATIADSILRFSCSNVPAGRSLDYHAAILNSITTLSSGPRLKFVLALPHTPQPLPLKEVMQQNIETRDNKQRQ
jgi:uncharacterized protein (DUF2249 family)